MDCKLLIIRNVSHISRQEKLSNENEYHQALVKTRSHEDLTPLNAIINITEVMLEDETISKDQQQSLNIIWSSGKLLEYNIQSSLSCMQIKSNCFEFNYIEMSPAFLTESIQEVMKPFQRELDERKI